MLAAQPASAKPTFEAFGLTSGQYQLYPDLSPGTCGEVDAQTSGSVTLLQVGNKTATTKFVGSFQLHAVCSQNLFEGQLTGPAIANTPCSAFGCGCYGGWSYSAAYNPPPIWTGLVGTLETTQCSVGGQPVQIAVDLYATTHGVGPAPSYPVVGKGRMVIRPCPHVAPVPMLGGFCSL